MFDPVEPIVAELEEIWSRHRLRISEIYLSHRQARFWLAKAGLSKRRRRRLLGKMKGSRHV